MVKFKTYSKPLSYFLVFVLALGCLSLKDSLNQKPSIATINITGITRSFVRKEAALKASSQAKERHMKAFKLNFESSVTQLAKEKQLIILPREAVIQGAPDYTKELLTLMGRTR